MADDIGKWSSRAVVECVIRD